ncbi:MAG: hypothetical protein ACLQPH_20620 [Acidimicrobiales bacterium]
MSDEHHDRWIECLPDHIRVLGCYFPWGAKRIPYRSIRALRRVDIGTFSGKGRI